jgi:hypothetical protein
MEIFRQAIVPSLKFLVVSKNLGESDSPELRQSLLHTVDDETEVAAGYQRIGKVVVRC